MCCIRERCSRFVSLWINSSCYTTVVHVSFARWSCRASPVCVGKLYSSVWIAGLGGGNDETDEVDWQS